MSLLLSALGHVTIVLMIPEKEQSFYYNFHTSNFIHCKNTIQEQWHFMPIEFSQKYQGMACFPVLILFYNQNFMKYTFFFKLSV